MTDFNDGRWHGWQNDTAECPVHRNSRVNISAHEGAWVGVRAGDCSWKDNENPIRAFQVTKVHRDPREFWGRFRVDGRNVGCVEAIGENILPPPNWETDPESVIIKLREVQE